MFDVDRDGVLSRDELHEMVVALLEVWKDNRTDTLPVSPQNIDVGRHGPYGLYRPATSNFHSLSMVSH